MSTRDIGAVAQQGQLRPTGKVERRDTYVGRERVPEDQATNGVSIPIRAMGVELSAIVTLLDVDLGEVAHAGDLHVVLGGHPVHAGERALRHDAGAVALLHTPRDLLALRLANGAVRVRRCPQTEVVHVVEVDVLAGGGLRGGGTAVVDAGLALFGGVGEGVVPLGPCMLDDDLKEEYKGETYM